MKKILSFLLVFTVAFSLTGCSEAVPAVETDEAMVEEVPEEDTEGTLSGTISSIDGDVITITDEAGAETSFTVTESTEYSFDMGEMPSENTQDGSLPQMSTDDGQASGDGSTPTEMPTGDSQQGSNPPEMPSGDGQTSGDGSTPPEMPTGDNQQGGNPPEMPSGDGQASGDGNTPPEMPTGDSQQGGNPPEMPSGDGQASGDGSTPPEMPTGDNQQGGMPQNMPEGDMMQMPSDAGEMVASADMLTVGTSVTVTLNDDGTAASVSIQISGNFGGQAGGNFDGGFGGDFGGGFGGSEEISYTAANTYEEDYSISGVSFSSTGKDENAILVTDGDVTLNTVSVDRVSSESTGGDNSSFYGVGAAVLTTGGNISISDSEIITDAAGGAGVFAYGDGTAYVSDTTIKTTKGTSGGIHVAGGGTLYAWDLDVETEGESSAAIRSDRGSGTMVVDGGSYTSNGTGSPAIYSTADISVNNAELSANASEAICIEGKNSIRLFDCDLYGNMSDNAQNDCTWNVILYQSMSGDSVEGNSVFEMVGGTLTAENGGIFYTTNTESTFIISDVEITYPEDCEFFLKCTGNSNQRGWGSTGSNGADCSFSAIGQDMVGDIVWDSISTLDFYMTDGSTLTGAFINDESCAGNGGSGYCALNLGEGCTWIVAKDSYLTSLSSSGNIVDANGNNVTVVGSDGTVYVEGSSDIVVTVESYNSAADLSGCGTVSSFADYAVEKKF